MNSVLVLAFSIIPSILLGLFIYYKDKIEKEPKTFLFFLFILGIMSAVSCYIINEALSQKISFIKISFYNLDLIHNIIKLLIFTALIEEAIKWFFSIFTFWDNKNFNHIFDPIVYCSFVGIGFATVENIMYNFAFSSLEIMPLILRGLISVPCHVVFSIVMGYYIGIAKNETRPNKLKALLKSIFIPVILHFIYDLLLAYKLYYIFTVFVIILYCITYININKIKDIKIKKNT